VGKSEVERDSSGLVWG